MEPQALADVRLTKAQQRFCNVSGGSWTATGQLVLPPYLELEADVELAEIMQKGEECQAGRGRVGEVVRTCRPDEPRPQHGIAKQRFEARCDVGAMMLEAMKPT